MKNKNFIVQNLIIFFPFVHLLFINFFQIRKTELIKLLLFASVYLLLFNFVRYFFKKFIYLKNSDYFAVILFYLLFNYSNITIYIYFQAFDFIKFIPNYSFLIFTALLIVFLYISTKINLNKFFEFLAFGYFMFLIVISLDFITINQEVDLGEVSKIESYEDIVLVDKPNIYFIIFDGLPSLATMESFYDYDTNQFLKLIEDNNLQNYELASSSFGRTKYTMSSLFNMEYIFEDGTIPFSDREGLSKAFVSGNTIFENILRENGYALYKFGLAFNCNSEKNDICITKNIKNYQEKDSVYFDLLMRTPVKIIVEKGLIKLNPSLSIGCVDGCRDPEIGELFNNISNDTEPRAIFLHFMDTHGPYLLGENCDLLDEPIFDLPKTNVSSYKKSLECAYLKFENLIEKLDLENDVVYIQSDHGPNYEKMELTSIEDLSIEQILNRYSIFSISNLENICDQEELNFNNSVNTFIHFINCFSNAKKPVLEVRNFLAFGKVEEVVFDITTEVQETIYRNYK